MVTTTTGRPHPPVHLTGEQRQRIDIKAGCRLGGCPHGRYMLAEPHGTHVICRRLGWSGVVAYSM